MTQDKHSKQRVRDRMLASGETYTEARESLRAEDDRVSIESGNTEVWRDAVAKSYALAIAQFTDALQRCPDDRWGKNVWVVKQTDPYAWPIHRGVGESLSPANRLQLQSAFWNVAYHAIFHLDFGLEGGWKGAAYEPPDPFRGDDHFGNCLPWRVYTRDELVDYLSLCDRKAAAVLADQAAVDAAFADLLVSSLLHLNEHLAQLNLFLER